MFDCFVLAPSDCLFLPFYPCRLKTQSTFICLSLPFASRILPFAFQYGVLKRLGTFIAYLLLGGLSPLPFNVMFLASGTQIH
jgi:hypothetical protein